MEQDLQTMGTESGRYNKDKDMCINVEHKNNQNFYNPSSLYLLNIPRIKVTTFEICKRIDERQ